MFSLPFSVSVSGNVIEINHRPAVGREIVFLKNLTTTGS